ncbi:MAG: carbamoyl phosphate synthase large subunit, partial [Thermodesulfobacteriota bacterium]
DHTLYILEVNPRASRTVPFVSKATGVPLAKVATKVMLGLTLEELGLTGESRPAHVSVKESVFPFNRFPGVDTILGPEMKSTGEVMGIADGFGEAYAKSQFAAGQMLPTAGRVFVSVRDRDKKAVAQVAREFARQGFQLVATRGTAAVLRDHGLEVDVVNKYHEGQPHVIDLIKNGDIALIINTAKGRRTVKDAVSLRRNALLYKVPYVTTIAGAWATTEACEVLRKKQVFSVKSLQEYHPQGKAAS